MHVLSSKIRYFNFRMFLFSFGCVVFFRALLLLLCFDCEFLLDFVLYFYSANWFYFARHMAEAETRKKCECHSSSKAVPRTIFTSHTLIFRSAWVGVWLRFVYVHLSGFNVRSSVKSTARKKRFTFQRLVSAVSCLCFTVMCGFSFQNVRSLHIKRNLFLKDIFCAQF